MLVFIEDEKHMALLARTPGVECVITRPEMADRIEGRLGLAVCAAPRKAFYTLHNHLACSNFYGRDFPANISPSARVHERAYVAERNIVVGPGTVIHPNATILDRSELGADCVIYSGAVVSATGFQFTLADGVVLDMLHAGGVKLGDRVQVLAGAVIAGAVFGDQTTIGDDCRIGNLAFVSHNVQMGPACVVGHGAVVNGNVRMGRGVWIGPGATITDSVSIGDGAQVSLGSTVIDDVPAGKRVTGNVAIDHRRYLRLLASALR